MDQNSQRCFILFYNFGIETAEGGIYNVREASEDFMYIVERCHWFFKNNWDYYKIDINKCKNNPLAPPYLDAPIAWFYVNQKKMYEARKTVLEDNQIIEFFDDLG